MRTRITATVAALVLLALSGAGLIIFVLETARINAAARASAEQEVAEFAHLQAVGVDPRTGRPFADARALLDTFLSRNVPADDELLIGWVDGRARYVSAGAHGALASDPLLSAAVSELRETGNERLIETSFGEVLVTVQPVEESTGGQAALVITTFMDDARAELVSLMRTYAVVSLLSIAGIVGIAALVAGRLLAPIRRLNETARAISETDLTARLPVSGNDDLTDLTVTANEMLDRLEAAFGAQRQFLDDAGHELKTPLTVLRGHLELLDGEDAAELAETRALLLDEVDRMSRLVRDLILLTKSRRPDFLVTSHIDLSHLTHTLLAKARALGDRAWALDAVAQGVCSLDEQRVTQAVLQLADNAVKHTDPGTVVALGSAVDAGCVRLWVRDEGDGIARQDRAAALQRFGRGRVRPGDDGFGLGLSIVRAIADAHGGEVTIHDVQPRGVRVEITLRPQDHSPPDPAPWEDTQPLSLLPAAEEGSWHRS